MYHYSVFISNDIHNDRIQMEEKEKAILMQELRTK